MRESLVPVSGSHKSIQSTASSPQSPQPWRWKSIQFDHFRTSSNPTGQWPTNYKVAPSRENPHWETVQADGRRRRHPPFIFEKMLKIDFFCQPWSRWRTRWLWGWDWPKRFQSICHRGEVGPRIIPPLSHKDEIKLSCFKRKFRNFHSRAQPASWQVGNGDGKVKVTVMVKEPSSMQDWGIAELVDEDYDIMQRTSWQGLWKTSLAWSRLNSSPASSSFTPGLPWVKWIDDSSEVFSDYMYIYRNWPGLFCWGRWSWRRQ